MKKLRRRCLPLSHLLPPLAPSPPPPSDSSLQSNIVNYRARMNYRYFSPSLIKLLRVTLTSKSSPNESLSIEQRTKSPFRAEFDTTQMIRPRVIISYSPLLSLSLPSEIRETPRTR